MKSIKIIIAISLIASIGTFAYYSEISHESIATTIDKETSTVSIRHEISHDNHIEQNNQNNESIHSESQAITSAVRENNHEITNRHRNNNGHEISTQERIARSQSRIAPPPPLIANQSRDTRHDNFMQHNHDHGHVSQNKQDFKAPQPAH